MKITLLRYTIFCACTLSLTVACNRAARHNDAATHFTQEQLIEANKRKIDRENVNIDSFIAQTDWRMKETKTGLRYEVYHHGEGDSARTGMVAEVTYRALLLDGTQVATTPPGETRPVRIGQDDEVTGLHEALGMLAIGDSARFILPSHLAYGLTGLNKKVPPNAAIFYDLHLVDLH